MKSKEITDRYKELKDKFVAENNQNKVKQVKENKSFLSLVSYVLKLLK